MSKNQLRLPRPKHKMGYTWKELKRFMSEDELDDFGDWIYGQTVTANEDGESVFYSWDVERFIRLSRFDEPTFFD